MMCQVFGYLFFRFYVICIVCIKFWNQNKLSPKLNKLQLLWKYFYSIFQTETQSMHQDSYNQRLKQIRQKYGATIKETTSCLRTGQPHTRKSDTNYDQKYTLAKNPTDTKIAKWDNQNTDPTFSTRYSSTLARDQNSNYDSFLYTQSKDERLKEIQKIRKNVAESRNKALEDWNAQVQRSKSKLRQSDRLKDRTNMDATFNPQDYSKATFKGTIKQNGRNRAQSAYLSNKYDAQLSVSKQLRRKYDYTDISNNRYQDNDKFTSSVRPTSVTKYQRQDLTTQLRREKQYITSGLYYNSKDLAVSSYGTMSKISPSQNTSPIRGLMKLESLEKPKKTSVEEEISNITSKSITYDLSNIDKIQDRIQRILGKK